jgi:hypothetical protein
LEEREETGRLEFADQVAKSRWLRIQSVNRVFTPTLTHKQYLLQAGDAPLSVRVGVLAALRDFQEGYVKRNPKELDSFMNRPFPKKDDILPL